MFDCSTFVKILSIILVGVLFLMGMDFAIMADSDPSCGGRMNIQRRCQNDLNDNTINDSNFESGDFSVMRRSEKKLEVMSHLYGLRWRMSPISDVPNNVLTKINSIILSGEDDWVDLGQDFDKKFNKSLTDVLDLAADAEILVDEPNNLRVYLAKDYCLVFSDNDVMTLNKGTALRYRDGAAFSWSLK